MQKLIALIVGGVVLLGSLSPLNAAGLPDELWTPATSPQGNGWRSLFISDGSTLNREPSILYAEVNSDNGRTTAAYHCESVDSPKCVELTRISSAAFLQPCTTYINTNCLEGVYGIDPSGKRITGEAPYEYPLNAEWSYPGINSMNLPTGGSPTIWNLPGAPHSGGGSLYLVQAFAVGALKKPANTKVTTERFVMDRLFVNLIPVKIVNGRFVRQKAQDSTETMNGAVRGVNHSSQDEWRACAALDNGSCAQRQAFPEGFKFGVTVRLQEKLTGWLHGRIYNPNVSITTNMFGEQVIDVSASPVRVPVVGEWFRWEDLTADIQKYILDGKVQGGQGWHESKALASGNFQEMTPTSGANAFEALSLWIPQIKDKASASPSTWTFNSLPMWELKDANACIRDSTDLVGFVTTNAAVYSAGPPAFNKELESLDYKVIAPHYTASGEVFKGTYDLRIRASVARCIYGFTNAPIQASISIIGEDGSAQVATQTINEVDGWLSLSANGFTYSAPTISVKLRQDAPVVAPAPDPTPEPVVAPTVAPTKAPKKVTIKCVKGKKVRSVSALAPKCPVGFRKQGA